MHPPFLLANPKEIVADHQNLVDRRQIASTIAGKHYWCNSIGMTMHSQTIISVPVHSEEERDELWNIGEKLVKEPVVVESGSTFASSAILSHFDELDNPWRFDFVVVEYVEQYLREKNDPRYEIIKDLVQRSKAPVPH